MELGDELGRQEVRALVLERVAVGGLVALAPGRVIRAIAPPESDTEPASAWKGCSANFAPRGSIWEV